MMRIILILFVLVVIAAVVGAVAYARSTSRSYATSNEVVPGVPTSAPAEWAGSHSPEARLHRRLRDAVAAMRANVALGDPAYSDARVTLEQEAVAVDERLIAVAALPGQHRAERLPAVANAVDAIESVVAEMVDATTASSDTAARLAEVRTRLDLVAQARGEIAEIESSSQLGDLAAGLTPAPESEPAVEPEPEPEPATEPEPEAESTSAPEPEPDSPATPDVAEPEAKPEPDGEVKPESDGEPEAG